MFYLPSYAAAFRCIGQELQSQNIEVFELKSHADVFRLQCRDPNPPSTGLKEMLFSKETLQMIDREGRRRRGQSTGEIRFDSTAEMLRTVGQYILVTKGLEQVAFAVFRSHDPAGTQFDISWKEHPKVQEGYKEDGWKQPMRFVTCVVNRTVR